MFSCNKPSLNFRMEQVNLPTHPRSFIQVCFFLHLYLLMLNKLPPDSIHEQHKALVKLSNAASHKWQNQSK